MRATKAKLAALGLTLTLSTGALAQTPSTLRTASVLQFLIDSRGTGLIEAPLAYCVSDARNDRAAGAELLERLSSQSARIVGSASCDTDGSAGVVLDDGTHAVLVWARAGTEAESRRSRSSIEGADWEAEAVLMRAQLRNGELGVDYFCWVRAGAPHDVLHCDVRIVT